MLLLIFKLLLVVCCVNSYDIGLCKEYYNKGSDRGDTIPVSIPFDYLDNYNPKDSNIFSGNFLINPSNFGKTWISFKPIGSYSVGQEYQVAFDVNEIEIGLIDDVRFKKRLEIGSSWVPVKIVVKNDGKIQIEIGEDKKTETVIYQLPEIQTDKPGFLEFKGPNHKCSEIIVYYDCVTKALPKVSAKSARRPSNGNRKLISAAFSSQPATLIDTNDYDARNCEYYNFQGSPGNKPISIPFTSLHNNKVSNSDIFRGNFLINPEKYSTVWISFKPIGEYAKGEEYQIVIYPQVITIGTIEDNNLARLNLSKKLSNWVSTEIVLHSDGTLEVKMDGVQEQLQYQFKDISRNPPKFIELKGPNSDTNEFSLFYDCTSFLQKVR